MLIAATWVLNTRTARQAPPYVFTYAERHPQSIREDSTVIPILQRLVCLFLVPVCV